MQEHRDQPELDSLQWACLLKARHMCSDRCFSNLDDHRSSQGVGPLQTSVAIAEENILYKLFYRFCGWLHDGLSCHGDASSATGGSRSRVGKLMCWGDQVLSWKSKRAKHLYSTCSAFEAELDAAATTPQTGVH